MDRTVSGHLFVSYCHADERDMLAFGKHLKGMLLDKVEVRTGQKYNQRHRMESGFERDP
jgi:hypothetical protein